MGLNFLLFGTFLMWFFANANFLSIWVNLKAETLKPADAKPSAIIENLSDIPAAIASLNQLAQV